MSFVSILLQYFTLVVESCGCFAQDIAGWAENDRGVSFIFGPDVVTTFLQMLAGSFKAGAYNLKALSR